VDRFDELTQRLLADLDRQGDRPAGPDCLRPEALGQIVAGSVSAQQRERIERHLDECSVCLDRLLEIRADIQAIMAPGRVSPRLARTLERLLGGPPRSLPARLAGRVRGVLALRIPVWTVAGVAAAVLLTWMALDRFQRPFMPVPAPIQVRDPTDRLTPAHARTQRKVSGTVSAVRDATSNGVEAHIVDLEDSSGASYILFTWGRPQIRPGDAVEVDAILTAGTQTVGRPVHQGLATALRKVR
jgi:hypothetical protein